MSRTKCFQDSNMIPILCLAGASWFDNLTSLFDFLSYVDVCVSKSKIKFQIKVFGSLSFGV